VQKEVGGEGVNRMKEVGCRNLNLGLATKVRACKGVGQKRARSHISCS
jgi:hypothetical protein